MAFSLDDTVAVLARTPALMDCWLRGLPPGWMDAREGKGTWSAFDVVGHLIDGEETDWMPRARIIVSGAATRRFEPYDRFRHLARNRGRTLDSLLDEFAALRAANLADLKSLELTPGQLALTAQHPELGSVTLAQLLATWVVHDLGHIAQVARVMARQYAVEVGPWRQYLPVLTRG